MNNDILKEGQTLHGNLYDYAINKQMAPGLFLGMLKVRGDLGQIESGFLVDITTNDRYSSNLIETIICQKKKVFVYTHHDSNIQLHDNLDWVMYGQHKYRGQMKDGIPHGDGEMKWQNCSVYKGKWDKGRMHGFGIMTWPSGKRYEGNWNDNQQTGQGLMFYPNGSIYDGEFLRGIRQGHGILRQPNGEYYEGEFINDKISNKGVFYDEKGKEYEIKESLHNRTEKLLLSKFWSKTWRLWAAIMCFCFAILTAVWIFDFFSGRGPSHMRVKAILAPIFLVITGFKLLISFFNNLNSTNK